MKDQKIQMRGHCQCCCRIQAVRDNRIAKHGYEVKDRGVGGWFSGVCDGHRFAPVQVDRKVLDDVVANIRKQTTAMREQADRFECGKSHPDTVPTSQYDHEKKQYLRVKWADAESYEQKRELKSAIWNLRNRARAGEGQVDMMIDIANEVHGQPLQQHTKPEAPPAVLIGERRINGRGAVVATRLDGGRVYWTDPKGGKSWTGLRSWRALAKA